MIEATSDVTVPAPPEEVFAAVSDLDHADWLPAVRRLRHVGGPRGKVGARYEVEVGAMGRHLRGVLVCKELTAPSRMVMELEEGIKLTIRASVRSVRGGSRVEISARYAVGSGPFGSAVERASQGAARREVARACEQLAARFGRKTEAGRRA
ncbi:MAG: SRPBCC family protein [Candidatus Dormibacteraeota bacterium]|nr:SRPBCC family protein [Candidatus Dormibacteraeota bacterium]MBV9525935.1 SRPBCC family protein [Candidatus Dormibacteraeota bacterium]